MREESMVLESARRHLATLGPLAKQLNEASDAFTEELKAIEAELNNLNLGVEVTLDDSPLSRGDLKEDFDDGTQESLGSYRLNHYLGYGRYAEDWGLLVRTFLDYEDRDGEVIRSVFQYDKPLVRASRDLRIAAA